ncbi:MotA/TolQ/ExbB proton channel family protein [bacterium]|nr:MotA/TolQ/ExbB proton channel family protein [bacterium]
MDLGNLDYIHIFRSSFTLIILLFCSLLAVTFAVERFLFYRRARGDSTRFLSKIKMSLENDDYQGAISLCERDRSPVAAVLRVGLINHELPYHQVEELMTAVREEERVKLERYLGVLGTLGNAAPFIGLFGTVVGIIKAFSDLAASGSGGPTVVAAGIAEALVATAGGLAVAIPCVMIFNFFMRKVKTMSVEMEAVSTRYLVMLEVKKEEASGSRKR